MAPNRPHDFIPIYFINIHLSSMWPWYYLSCLPSAVLCSRYSQNVGPGQTQALAVVPRSIPECSKATHHKTQHERGTVYAAYGRPFTTYRLKKICFWCDSILRISVTLKCYVDNEPKKQKKQHVDYVLVHRLLCPQCHLTPSCLNWTFWFSPLTI